MHNPGNISIYCYRNVLKVKKTIEESPPYTNACSYSDVKPIMMDLPYPPIQVTYRNQALAREV